MKAPFARGFLIFTGTGTYERRRADPGATTSYNSALAVVQSRDNREKEMSPQQSRGGFSDLASMIACDALGRDFRR